MSVKQSLLALLAQGPMYGAQLREEFEARTGGTWPINVGQIYTTLGRLERDGLVFAAGELDARGTIQYHLTPRGREVVDNWWATPVDRNNAHRDELTIKLAIAVTVPGVDVRAVTQAQRTATLANLRDLTRLKQTATSKRESATTTPSDLAWLLVLENLIFAGEAEVRWLDHVETRLHQEASRAPRDTTTQTTQAAYDSAAAT